MRISANKLCLYVLEKRRRILDEICTNAVQIFSTESHVVRQLLTSATALPVFDEKAGVRIVVQIENELRDKELACEKMIVKAKHDEKSVSDAFGSLVKSEIRAHSIREEFAASIKRFEQTPSTDKKVADMQRELARLKEWLSQKTDPALENFKAAVNEASSSNVFEYLKAKSQAEKSFTKLDKLLASWINFDEIRQAFTRGKEYRKELSAFKTRRESRIADIEALIKMRTEAFREESRLKIADDLNKALAGVEHFERIDEERRKSVVKLYTLFDIFKPAMFQNAVALILQHEPDLKDVTAAQEEQLKVISEANLTQAAFLRVLYQNLSELLPYLSENLAEEAEFEFESPEEFMSWLSGANWVARDITDRFKQRIVLKDEVALKA